MDIRFLIQRLQARGLTFEVEGDRVKVEAPREPDLETKAQLNEAIQRKAEVIEALKEDDPVLSPDQWYSEFHRFHIQVVKETPDLDWQQVKREHPELHQAIKAKENEIDSLGNVRLSVVMGIMTEWRQLVMQVVSK